MLCTILISLQLLLVRYVTTKPNDKIVSTTKHEITYQNVKRKIVHQQNYVVINKFMLATGKDVTYVKR